MFSKLEIAIINFKIKLVKDKLEFIKKNFNYNEMESDVIDSSISDLDFLIKLIFMILDMEKNKTND